MVDKSEPMPRGVKVHPKAKCGSLACGGCYSVGDGKVFHSPRAGYDQEQLITLDKLALQALD
jgi:hypothetical protein